MKIDGKKLKYGKKNGMPSKYEFFNGGYNYSDLPRGKLEEEIDEKSEWYVKTYQIDEGMFELEIDGEFDQSKLVYNG